MSSTNDHCAPQRSPLAEGPFCKLELCACGTVHLSLGPLTLRLRPEVVESLWTTLGDALGALYRRHQACPQRGEASGDEVTRLADEAPRARRERALS